MLGKTMPKGPLLLADWQQTLEKREKWRKQKKEWRDVAGQAGAEASG